MLVRIIENLWQPLKLTIPSGPPSRDQTWSWQTFWVVFVLFRHLHASSDVPILRLLVTVPLQMLVSIIQSRDNDFHRL